MITSGHCIYLDANASEPIRPKALSAMIKAAELVGNPSSVHQAGRKNYNAMEDARDCLADLFGSDPQNAIFTSGGTEADILAIYGQIGNRPLWIGATEHPAIRQVDLPKKILPVNSNGVIDLVFLEQALAEAEIPPMVCLMMANNETGVIHPIGQVASLCHQYGAILHVDAIQACGRLTVNLNELTADSLALSGHKMGGPKGAGLLLLAETESGSARPLMPLLLGGGQEQGRRGGTPALPAIIGMASAAQEAYDHPRSDLKDMRDEIEREARKLGAIIAGDDAERLENTSCLIFPGCLAQQQVMALDLAGFCVSSGSACSSGKVNQSPVLLAMGFGELASCAIRVSLPWNVEESAIGQFIEAYRKCVKA